jgi:hypothetical protein
LQSPQNNALYRFAAMRRPLKRLPAENRNQTVTIPLDCRELAICLFSGPLSIVISTAAFDTLPINVIIHRWNKGRGFAISVEVFPITNHHP